MENGAADRVRIDHLEEFRREISEDMKKHLSANAVELREMREAIHELSVAIRISNSHACPAPGTCLRLEPNIEKLEAKLDRELEKIAADTATRNADFEKFRRSLERRVGVGVGIFVAATWMLEKFGPIVYHQALGMVGG